MPNVSRPDWSGRLRALQSTFTSTSREAFVVTAPTNVTYLSGFSASAQVLLLTADACYLVTDGRYAFALQEATKAGSVGPVIFERVDRRYDLTVAELAVRLGLRRIGFEAGHVTVALLEAWQRAAPGVTWTASHRDVEQLRIIKDSFEIDILRRGGAALAKVASALGSLVHAGQSERELAAAIETAMEREGFSNPAFPTIVASGPNSALPHARPTDRRLTQGDLVVLDFGGVLEGYCVDLTRMAGIGRITDEASHLYRAVREAHGAGLAAIKPGVMSWEVDGAARSVLERAGLGEAFMHGTGHGLGLEVHEAPRVARRDPEFNERVAPGMVFTVEPGAYVADVGGVRLEDDVLVTADGYEVLTEAPRELLVV